MPSSKQRRFVLPLIKYTLLVTAVIAVLLAIYCVHLDRQVREQFEGKRFSLPARVYARPLELFPGMSLKTEHLKAELDYLNYQFVQSPEKPGEYSYKNNVFVINLRPFLFWDGHQEARRIKINLQENQLGEITDLEIQQPLNLIRLDPLYIGGFFPGKGEDRELIRLEQTPKHLIDALIAIEDQRFYSHIGVDPKAIARAISTVVNGERVQGGSTITQQLVKNFFLTPERTLKRKFTEMLMALLLERRYEKDEILETYLNEVYFGQDKNRAIHGFGLASRFYFQRDIQQLELHQSALLVALLKGPAYYNPRKNPERALERRNLVISEMFREAKISNKEADAAKLRPLDIVPEPDLGQSQFPAFLSLVMRQLTRDYQEEDLRSEGLRIFTTLDPVIQKTAERSLNRKLAELERARALEENTLEGAVVVTNVQNGEVTALVGGRHAQYQGFNRALDASRQIGSLLKPALYLAALAQPDKYTLATTLDDTPLKWEEPGIEAWEPQNYDLEYHGEIPLWMALAESYNVAASRLGLEVGLDEVVATAKKLGITQELPTYASTLLGTVQLTPIEVTQMYHTIANGGFRVPFRAIREIMTKEGEPLNRYDLKIEQAVPAEPVHLITHGLQQVVREGTGKSLNNYLPPEINAAGKTGTTDGLRDSWFAGFTGDKVAVVWVGNDENQSTGLTGATGALTVWGDMMAQLNPMPLVNQEPENITYVVVDKLTGRPTRNCDDGLRLPFIAGSEPENSVDCSGRKKNIFRKWINKIF